MADHRLELIVRTPRQTVLESAAGSLRIPTETGQVGLRPRAEACVLSVEPGLVLVRDGTKTRFVGTAGGLLRWDGATAELLTPLAVSGPDEAAVMAELDRALASPNEDLAARRLIARLESDLVGEIRRGGRPAGPGPGEERT